MKSQIFTSSFFPLSLWGKASMSSAPGTTRTCPAPSQLHLLSSRVEARSQVSKKKKPHKINSFSLHIISMPFSSAVTGNLLDRAVCVSAWGQLWIRSCWVVSHGLSQPGSTRTRLCSLPLPAANAALSEGTAWCGCQPARGLVCSRGADSHSPYSKLGINLWGI